MRCIVRLYIGIVIGIIIVLLGIRFIHQPANERILSKGKHALLLSQRNTYWEQRRPLVRPAVDEENSQEERGSPQDLLFLGEITSNLHQLMKDLTRLKRKLQSPAVKHQLQGPITQVRQLLGQLSPNFKYEETSNNGTSKISNTIAVPDVCPENFTSVDLSGGYPFFYKGFNMLNCTGVPKFSGLVTLVFNTVKQRSKYLASDLDKMISNIHTVYPNIKIIIATAPKVMKKVVEMVKSRNVQFIEFESRLADMDIWNAAIKKVLTRYTFIARDVVHFSWHGRLERLVREIKGLNSFAVAGSYRLMSGLWSHGCEQSRLQNYTLAYRSGYDWSEHECMVCDTVQGPFMARTTVLKKHPFPERMSAVSGFETWFLSAKKDQNLVVSCPDSMFFARKNNQTEKDSWKDLAAMLQIEHLKLSSGIEHRFTCSEAMVSCAKQTGNALSHCCMNELSKAVKLFLHLCKESGSLCELQEGSLLGAVKFDAILPWERDADITFHSSNFSAINALEPKLSAAGYILSHNKKPWCCVDGVVAGGIFTLHTNSWTIELYGQHLMDSEKLLHQKISPTLIELDGQLVAAPASPALYTRNRYGHGVFQHAQHWMTMQHTSGWAFYIAGTFTDCKTPGHHACLDQYLADGNLQFKSVDP